MSTVVWEKCPVCTAPLTDSQNWHRTKTTTLRSSSGKRATTGQQTLNRSGAVTQQRLASSSTQNLESEYIRQLQEQIYYLETECHYLRDQMNKNSIVLSRTLNDDRAHKAELERDDLQRSLVQTSSHFDQLSSEKHGLTIALDELRLKFDVEKQNLLDELDMLQRARTTFEQDKRTRDQELQKIRDRSRVAADELKSALAKIAALEQQLERHLVENKVLTDENYQLKLESNDLQRTVNDQVLAARERDRLQGIVADLERETETLRQELKAQDNRYTDAQFLRNKLTDEKGALMKEVTRLENLTKEFERQLDQLRINVRERTDQLQAKDKELAALRKKEQSFRITVESIQSKLDSEAVRNRDLDEQLKQLQRQLNVEVQTALTAQRDSNEYGLRNTRLQDEINALRRDKDQLTSLISTLQERLANEESSTRSLRLEIQSLEDRVKEIDRLKALEDLIQTQRWDDISQMAQTMQSVSRTMARATSPTTTRRRIELQ